MCLAHDYAYVLHACDIIISVACICGQDVNVFDLCVCNGAIEDNALHHAKQTYVVSVEG